jgi:hypothetical protein
MARCILLSAALVLIFGLSGAYTAEWHVSPQGSGKGDGIAKHPWDLQTALSGAPNDAGSRRIAPGDTVWLQGGTYRGGFESTLAGTNAKPITVRQAHGQRAIIDCKPRDERDNGLFFIRGEHAIYWGFELTCSDPKRETALSGPWPSDIRRGGLDCRGSHIKLINLVIHDTGGIGSWSDGEGGEIYGCIIYHNGWKGPERGHGHAIYAQNRHGVKRLEDNIAFNQFGYGIHCYGSEKAFLNGFHIEGNASFNNGCLTKPSDRAPDILVGGGAPVRGLKAIDNFTYGGGLRCGYAWGVPNEDATLTGNYLVDGLYVRDYRRLTVTGNTVVADNSVVWLEGSQGLDTSRYAWDRNRYFRTGKQYADLVLRVSDKTNGFEFDAWRKATKLDEHSTYEEGRPSGTHVFVRLNRYETGRAHVIVYNWDEAGEVSIDLSKVLKRGQRFRVVSVQNLHGKPVVAGVYEGAPIRLPMRPIAAVSPVGMGEYKLPVTEPRFGAFVVLPE